MAGENLGVNGLVKNTSHLASGIPEHDFFRGIAVHQRVAARMSETVSARLPCTPLQDAGFRPETFTGCKRCERSLSRIAEN
jgi:hypothetical protein